MNSLVLLSLMLVSATTTPPITYEVITNEFYEHNTYSFIGAPVQESKYHTIYALNIKACEIRDSHYDIVDEMIKFDNKLVRKSFFFLTEDIINNRCLLFIQKRHKKPFYYMELDYWYPDYNHIHIIPYIDHRVRLLRRVNRRPRASHTHHRFNRRIITSHSKHKHKKKSKHRKR